MHHQCLLLRQRGVQRVPQQQLRVLHRGFSLPRDRHARTHALQRLFFEQHEHPQRQVQRPHRLHAGRKSCLSGRRQHPPNMPGQITTRSLHGQVLGGLPYSPCQPSRSAHDVQRNPVRTGTQGTLHASGPSRTQRRRQRLQFPPAGQGRDVQTAETFQYP